MAYFSENPIFATVTPGTFPAESTNRRVIVKIEIDDIEYPFYHSAESGVDIDIDVSSAYRSALAMYAAPYPTQGHASSPTVTGVSSVIGECVTKDGIIENVTCGISGGGCTARLGRYTEMQRLNGTAEAPTILTNKPNRPEVVKIGSTVRLGNSAVTAESGLKTFSASGHEYYGEDNRDRHTMYFLNQYGEVESVSVVSMESLTVGVKTETIGQIRPPQSKSYAHMRAIHSGGKNKWKMSTGYLERDWLAWFAHDFMMSERHWVEVKTADANASGTGASADGDASETVAVVPVVITPDENMSIYDKASGDLLGIGFSCECALEGECELV